MAVIGVCTQRGCSGSVVRKRSGVVVCENCGHVYDDGEKEPPKPSLKVPSENSPSDK